EQQGQGPGRPRLSESEGRQPVAVTQQERFVGWPLEVQHLEQPVRAARVAGQVECEGAAPALAVAEEVLDLLRQVAEDEVELPDALAGAELDDVLQEGAVHQREHGRGVALVERGGARGVPGCQDNRPHSTPPSGKYRIANLEIRNNTQSRIPKPVARRPAQVVGYLVLGFVSDFEIAYSIFPRRGSVCAPAQQHGGDGLEEELDVQPEALALDVLHVQLDL